MWSSADFGEVKPSANLFEMAVSSVLKDNPDCSHSDILFTGDTYATDVAGAHRVGLKVAWINRRGEEKMKRFRNFVTVGLVGIMILALAGCDGNGGASTKSSEATASSVESQESVTELTSVSEVASSCEVAETSSEVVETASSSEVAETSSEVVETSEAEVPAHVEVTDQLVMTLADDSGEYSMIIPKLIVDGKEATAINAALKEFVEQNHPLEKTSYMYGDTEKWYVIGEETSYEWGVKGNMVSIVIRADETFTDGFCYDIFNYNVDTLEAASKEEVIKAFGMTVDEFNGKVADAYRADWNSDTYLQEYMADLDKSIEAIPSNATPFVTPDGNAGAAGLIYVSGFQFPEMIECYDLETLETVR